MNEVKDKGGAGPEDAGGLIRPALKEDEIGFRARPRGKEAAGIRKGLHTLHTLELMAVNIYRYQITKSRDELNRYLVSAMINEMTHLQDFQRKLFEYGWRPSRIRWAYWLVGFFFGFFSRMMGPEARLRTAIWVETKAVRHYGKLLEEIGWDDDTRRILEKNLDDERGHIERWRKLLAVQ